MGHRLSKIYTRTGDKGTTGMADGSRLNKSDLRIQSIGGTDELNSIIGLLLTESLPDECAELLLTIQHQLFDLGAELSLPPGNNRIQPQDTEKLEQALDRLNESLPPLKEFILPGGSKPAALCHLARTVCRRVERDLVALNEQTPVSELSLSYVNRLSDLFFVLARWLNKWGNHPDVLWEPAEKPTGR